MGETAVLVGHVSILYLRTFFGHMNCLNICLRDNNKHKVEINRQVLLAREDEAFIFLDGTGFYCFRANLKKKKH